MFTNTAEVTCGAIMSFANDHAAAAAVGSAFLRHHLPFGARAVGLPRPQQVHTSKRKERFTLSTCTRPLAEPVASADDSLLSMIKPEKILDLIAIKQTQFYSLWAVYTVVEFAAGSYGGAGAGKPSLDVVLAILLGCWLFNIGHLGFILQCVAQLSALRAILEQIGLNDKTKYRSKLKAALDEAHESRWFWTRYRQKAGKLNYHMQWVVHFSIDICASLALLLRADNQWIQSHIPAFLHAVPIAT